MSDQRQDVNLVELQDQKAVWASRVDDLTVSDLIRPLLRNMRLLVLAVFLGGLLAAYAVSCAPIVYSVTMMVRPKVDTTQSPGSFSGASGGLLSTLTDMGSNSTEFDIFLEMMFSPRIIERYQAEQHIFQKYYHDRWDQQHERWLPERHGMLGRLRATVNGWYGITLVDLPNAVKMSEDLKSSISISASDIETLKNLEYRFPDPKLAKEIMQNLYYYADREMRENMIQNLSSQGDYILQSIEKTKNIYQKNALISLLTNIEYKIVILNMKTPYAAEIVYGPYVSDGPVSPRPFFLIPLGMLAGFSVMAMTLILRNLYFKLS